MTMTLRFGTALRHRRHSDVCTEQQIVDSEQCGPRGEQEIKPRPQLQVWWCSYTSAQNGVDGAGKACFDGFADVERHVPELGDEVKHDL